MAPFAGSLVVNSHLYLAAAPSMGLASGVRPLHSQELLNSATFELHDVGAGFLHVLGMLPLHVERHIAE